MFGIGLPAICVGLLGFIMLPAQAAGLLVVPAWADAWQLAFGPALRAVSARFGNMLLPFCLGTPRSLRW